VSWVLFPFLSGRPAIFQVFFGVDTSIPHLGHLAKLFHPHELPMCMQMDFAQLLCISINDDKALKRRRVIASSARNF